MVGPDELLLVRAPVLHGEAAAEEVARVEHHRAPGDGLPVDRGERPGTARLAEEEVVEAVVAVDEAERRHVPVRPPVEAGHEGPHELQVLLGDPARVALLEAREELGQQRLVEHEGLVEPRARAQARVREDGRMELGQGDHRDPRLLDRAAADLVALLGGRDVLEHEGEPALLGLEARRVAGRQRVAEARRELAVEADLTLVGPEADPRRAARRVRGGELHDDARRAGGRLVLVAQPAPGGSGSSAPSRRARRRRRRRGPCRGPRRASPPSGPRGCGRRFRRRWPWLTLPRT